MRFHPFRIRRAGTWMFVSVAATGLNGLWSFPGRNWTQICCLAMHIGYLSNHTCKDIHADFCEWVILEFVQWDFCIAVLFQQSSPGTYPALCHLRLPFTSNIHYDVAHELKKRQFGSIHQPTNILVPGPTHVQEIPPLASTPDVESKQTWDCSIKGKLGFRLFNTSAVCWWLGTHFHGWIWVRDCRSGTK